MRGVRLVGEHKCVGALIGELGNPVAVASDQPAQREHAFALLRLGHVDVAAPVALGDLDGALFKVDVLDHQPGDLGYARPGVEAGLADEQVAGLVDARQDDRRLLLGQDAFLTDLPLPSAA